MSRKYGKVTAKDLNGLYVSSHYRTWSIKFPYMTEKFIFVGAETNAVEAAKAIQRKTEWPYSPKIREISEVV